MLRSIKLIIYLLIALPAFVLTGCKDDDGPRALPTFDDIRITPEKAQYQVGDEIVLSITMTNPGGSELRDASYWWYTSEWFSDLDITPDFCEINENKEFVSQPITLDKAGELTLYFFGKVEYPHYDWRKIEISRKITVAE